MQCSIIILFYFVCGKARRLINFLDVVELYFDTLQNNSKVILCAISSFSWSFYHEPSNWNLQIQDSFFDTVENTFLWQHSVVN